VDLEQLLELQLGPAARLLQPRRQGAAALGGDRVAPPSPLADRFLDRTGVAEPDQFLGLLVQLALGARPDPPQAQVDLLDQLVGGPALDR
jgi:hypothetical protein